jgi:nucleotide-binding universal stress UspA family protein
MGYRKVLVAFDVHDKGTALFHEALDLAVELSAELMLFCCIGQETLAEAESRVATFAELNASRSLSMHDRQRQNQLARVRAWLESLAITEKEDVRTRVNTDEGNPAQRICELAEQWGADLIVLGHSGRHPFREMLIGNINMRVLRDAPCAVLVTKRKWRGPKGRSA